MGGNCKACPVEDIGMGVSVIVEVPDGVTTCGGGGGGATAVVLAPAPQPTEPNAAKSKAAARALPIARRFPSMAFSASRTLLNARRATHANTTSNGHSRNPGMCRKRIRGRLNHAALPRVFTITVNGAGIPAVMVTLAGAMHAAPRGAPPHVNATVPL